MPQEEASAATNYELDPEVEERRQHFARELGLTSESTPSPEEP